MIVIPFKFFDSNPVVGNEGMEKKMEAIILLGDDIGATVGMNSSILC